MEQIIIISVPSRKNVDEEYQLHIQPGGKEAVLLFNGVHVCSKYLSVACISCCVSVAEAALIHATAEKHGIKKILGLGNPKGGSTERYQDPVFEHHGYQARDRILKQIEIGQFPVIAGERDPIGYREKSQKRVM